MPQETTKARLIKLDSLFEELYRLNTSKGDRCTICEARAMVGLIPRDDDLREDLFNRFMDLWNDVIRHVKELPLFPITHIADIFEFRFHPLEEILDYVHL